MARLLDLSQPTVWNWLKKGQSLPAEHVLKVEAATGVSRHDLRPDLYPREDSPRAPAGGGSPPAGGASSALEAVRS